MWLNALKGLCGCIFLCDAHRQRESVKIEPHMPFLLNVVRTFNVIWMNKGFVCACLSMINRIIMFIWEKQHMCPYEKCLILKSMEEEWGANSDRPGWIQNKTPHNCNMPDKGRVIAHRSLMHCLKKKKKYSMRNSNVLQRHSKRLGIFSSATLLSCYHDTSKELFCTLKV